MSFDASRLLLSRVSDAEVMARLTKLVQSGRRVTAEILVHLAEVDSRRLHLGAGYNSLFAYCVKAHGMSEDEACRRIEVARLGARFEAIWGMIASGDLSLSVAALLKGCLTETNHVTLLAAVCGKSVRAARQELAALFPMPDVPSAIRKLPQCARSRSVAAAAAAPSSGGAVAAERGLPARQMSGCGTRDIAGTKRARAAIERHPAKMSAWGPTEAEGGRTASDRHSDETEMPETGAGFARYPAQPNESEWSRVESKAPLEQDAQRETAAALAWDAARNGKGVSKGEAWSEGGGLSEGKAASEGQVLREDTLPSEDKVRSAAEEQACMPAVPGGARANGSWRERARLEAIAAGRYRVQFTVDSVVKERLELALDLMSHQNPARDFALVVGRGLELLVEDLLRKRMGKTGRARASGKSGSRRVRSQTRRAVAERDGLRCSFVSAAGRRCDGRAFLEFDHEHPFAQGGGSDLGNVRLLCRSHNRYCAELAFGQAKIAREIERKGGG